MEGAIVRGFAQPLRWQAGLGRSSVVMVQPPRRLSLRPQRVQLRVRCSKGQDVGEYLQAQVVEAVRMVPSQGHLYMTLTDGREVEVNHVNPSKGHLLYSASTPTIFLKMTDDSNLILPIVVGEAAVTMLMKGLHEGGKLWRPNQYQILKDIVNTLNYEARMVRVTERVMDTYYARIYIGKPGEDELLSVDARPSDAINLAVVCKVPIYVHKSIIASDGVRAVYKPVRRGDIGGRYPVNDSLLDSPDGEPDAMAEEMSLLRNMLLAVVEERYSDAARWRDQLLKFRALSEWQIRQFP